MMKKIFAIFCLLVATLFCWQPQADAKAIAVIPMGWGTNYPTCTDDQYLRDLMVKIVKEHAPSGYTITCSKQLDETYDDALHQGYYHKDFASAYGYDYVILIFASPIWYETVHFMHPRATFDIHEADQDMTGFLFTPRSDGYNYAVGSHAKDNNDVRYEDIPDTLFTRGMELIMQNFGHTMKMEDLSKPKLKMSDIL